MTTIAELEHLVTRINVAAGTPTEQYTRTDDGRCKANPGNYHLSSAYGGHQLCQMVNDGGGARNITSGYVSKRELYYQMRAFLEGMLSIKN